MIGVMWRVKVVRMVIEVDSCMIGLIPRTDDMLGGVHRTKNRHVSFSQLESNKEAHFDMSSLAIQTWSA